MSGAMRVDLFDFELPQERIALEPARPRDASRMLYVAEAGVADHLIRDLPSILRPGDLLVLNDTKVIPAQLRCVRPARAEGGGGDVEVDVTLHKNIAGDTWRAFVRPAKRLREGDELRFGDGFTAEVTARDGAEAELRFNVADGHFAAALNTFGAPPLPPYIARQRALSAEDEASYQTVYASRDGSVAAPTAGLHFTDDLLAALRVRGVETETVTLHVGAGTFLPVSVEDTDDHKMHSEWGEITEAQAARINQTRADGGRIVAVGTTSLRLLESAADDNGIVTPFQQETDIFITPGYRFKVVDKLLTNFHLPRSTLFMLVCAFAGVDKMQNAYKTAIEREYRFYSYGDACLLERAEND